MVFFQTSGEVNGIYSNNNNQQQHNENMGATNPNQHFWNDQSANSGNLNADYHSSYCLTKKI